MLIVKFKMCCALDWTLHWNLIMESKEMTVQWFEDFDKGQTKTLDIKNEKFGLF